MSRPRSNPSVLALLLGAGLPSLAVAQPAPDEEIEIEIEEPPATPEAEVAPAPAATPAGPSEEQRRLTELEARLAGLDARTASLESPPPPPPPPEVPWAEDVDLQFGGYVQVQGELHQDSVDELNADGVPLNQDRFLVRRGRLQATATWRFARAALELDANTVRGPFVYAKTAELGVFVPGPTDVPRVMLNAGMGDIPFGFELPQGSAERVFLERTLGSRALFPSESDVGARVLGRLGPVVYDLGEPYVNFTVTEYRRGEVAADGSYPVEETVLGRGELVAVQADGGASLGTFVAALSL